MSTSSGARKSRPPAAIAAKPKPLGRDKEHQLRKTGIIHELSQSLLRLRTLDEIGRTIAKLLMSIPHYDHVGLFMLDEPTKRLVPVVLDIRGVEETEVMRALSGEVALFAETGLQLGRGITGTVAETGKPIIVDDVRSDPRYIAAREDSASEACVPLKLPDGRVVGVLNVESWRAGAFSENAIGFLETVSALAAGALENARLFEETERRAAFLSVINEVITESTKGSGSLPDLLNSVLSRVLEVSRVEKGAVWLHASPDEKISPPLVRVLLGFPDEAGDVFLAVAESRQIAFDKTISVERRAEFPPPVDELARTYGLESAILVPVSASGGRIGGMAVCSSRVRLWTSDEISLLETMSGQLGLAVERALLDEERRRRLLELEAINMVSSALRTASTTEKMIPVLLDKALETLETDTGSIWIHDPETDLLRAFVSRGWLKNLDPFFTHAPDKGVTGKVLKTKEPHVLAEFAEDPLIPPEGKSLIPRGWSGAIVPIKTKTGIWGGITISLRHPRQFTVDEMRLLSSLTEMAGTAIHRMSLFEETTKRLSMLQSFQAVDRAIISSLDLPTTLNFILEHIIGQLNADASGVLLFDRQRFVLEASAGRGFRTDDYRRGSVRPGEKGAGQIVLSRETVVLKDRSELLDFVRRDLIVDEDFQSYAGSPLISKDEVRGVLELFFRKAPKMDKDWLFHLETLAGLAAIAIENAMMYSDLKRSHLELELSYDATIEGWAYALDLRDRETEHHTRRVTEITLRLALEMGVAQEQLAHIRRGALLHDIGKMSIPDSILLKPGPLSEEEWVVMKRHPTIAFEMLSKNDYLRPELDIPYCHHEKWDGSGYPRGLKGEEIPLPARIFAAIDVYDALTSDRPYRKAWPHQKALDYIREQSGKHFDPKVIDALMRMELVRDKSDGV